MNKLKNESPKSFFQLFFKKVLKGLLKSFSKLPSEEFVPSGSWAIYYRRPLSVFLKKVEEIALKKIKSSVIVHRKNGKGFFCVILSTLSLEIHLFFSFVAAVGDARGLEVVFIFANKKM